MAETAYRVMDMSGGIQRKSSPFMSKVNELKLILNGVTDRIGAISKVKGNVNFGTLNATSTSSSTSSSTSTSSTSSSTSTSTSSSTSTSTSTTA